MRITDWAQVASAGFAALASATALYTVIVANRERAARALPDLYIDVVHDIDANQVRATVHNYGGPAREVKIGGVDGPYGFFGLVGPTAYWRSGESRTVLLGMPVSSTSRDAYVFVEGRDVRMQYLFATAMGGRRKRWPLRQAQKLRVEDVFRYFFPVGPLPYEVPHPQISMQTIDRNW